MRARIWSRKCFVRQGDAKTWPAVNDTPVGVNEQPTLRSTRTEPIHDRCQSNNTFFLFEPRAMYKYVATLLDLPHVHVTV